MKEGTLMEKREPDLEVTHQRTRPSRGLIYRSDPDTYRRRCIFPHLPGKDPGGGLENRQV